MEQFLVFIWKAVQHIGRGFGVVISFWECLLDFRFAKLSPRSRSSAQCELDTPSIILFNTPSFSQCCYITRYEYSFGTDHNQ